MKCSNYKNLPIFLKQDMDRACNSYFMKKNLKVKSFNKLSKSEINLNSVLKKERQ